MRPSTMVSCKHAIEFLSCQRPIFWMVSTMVVKMDILGTFGLSKHPLFIYGHQSPVHKMSQMEINL
jgi:hypothetical protein